MPDLREYIAPGGKAPFSRWIESLNDVATRARIRARINRVRLANFGDCKPLGGGVFELRLAFGPGYRVYFGREGSELVVLLGGGDKSSQVRDIEKAKAAWSDYRSKDRG
jgi:putative addiction module killer protein